LKPTDSVALLTIDKAANKIVILSTDPKSVAETLGQLKPLRLNWLFPGPCAFPVISAQCST